MADVLCPSLSFTVTGAKHVIKNLTMVITVTSKVLNNKPKRKYTAITLYSASFSCQWALFGWQFSNSVNLGLSLLIKASSFLMKEAFFGLSGIRFFIWWVLLKALAMKNNTHNYSCDKSSGDFKSSGQWGFCQLVPNPWSLILQVGSVVVFLIRWIIA